MLFIGAAGHACCVALLSSLAANQTDRVGCVQLGFFSAHLVLNLITIPIEPGIELTLMDGNAKHDGN
jgi:hypothetical protein